ncbi:MAG: CHRD domain-containing protein [Vicinamibacterales bacterium]
MRRVISLVTAGVLVLLVTAVQAQAQANTMNFTAALSGGNEVPGVVTGSVGTATISLNTVTNVVTTAITVYNMPVGTTQSHFHVGAAGVGGPVVVNFTVPAGISNDYVINSTATATDLIPRAAQGINSWEDFIQALVLGNVYVNVHSTANPGGEIRGQVVRVP